MRILLSAKSFVFDGVGEYESEEILGCMNEEACNYNPERDAGRRILC